MSILPTTIRPLRFGNISDEHPLSGSLCKYSKLFGEAGSTKGLRKYRIFGIALLDVSVTLVCAVIFAWVFKLPYLQTIIAIFILGVLVHRVFCVRTAVDKMLFPSSLIY